MRALATPLLYSLLALPTGALGARQETLVRKVVSELKDEDNVHFEVQNEPWADRPVTVDVLHPYIEPEEMKVEGQYWQNRVDLADAASLEWQAWIASVVDGGDADGSSLRSVAFRDVGAPDRRCLLTTGLEPVE